MKKRYISMLTAVLLLLSLCAATVSCKGCAEDPPVVDGKPDETVNDNEVNISDLIK